MERTADVRNNGALSITTAAISCWALMSMAAWKGSLQLSFKPYYWEKTTHGFSMYDASLAPGHVRTVSGAAHAETAVGS